MDVDELYGAPLEQFVAQRGALARELRKVGKRAEAAEVAGLRKPSVAAWAINQLVRSQSRSVAELFDAGDALQEAHRTATAGRGNGEALRTASQRERAAVEGLVNAARGLLTSDGHELSATIIDRVADTLRAAALNGDARAKMRDGRLERELRHVGLGVMSSGDAGAAPAAAPKRRAKQPATRKGGKEEATSAGEARRREQRAEEERHRREHEQALKAAHEAESKARRRAERAVRALQSAQRLRDRAAEELDAAEQSLADAHADADEAAAELERARGELESI